MADYSIFAHSRPDKIGTPRLLPLYISMSLKDYQQKKPLKYYNLPSRDSYPLPCFLT